MELEKATNKILFARVHPEWVDPILKADENPYCYNLETEAICRYNNTIWTTDEGGDVDEFDCMSIQKFMMILENKN